ncbi:MAG: cytoplasmic protein [Candidatus Lokiarchaeota archaeon]|nr:cytoplasmic protein [Candidatus Lokiarchaeota archaeon]
MEKIALFAFNGDPMCFIHVILNALDMHEKGHEVVVVVEGSATKLASEFKNEDNPFYKLYKKLSDLKLISCFCQACSNKMGALEKVKEIGFPLCNELKGHPSMAKYIEDGYSIITF